METQNIVNVLNGSDNKTSKFATKNGMLLTMKQKVIIHTKIKKKKKLTSSLESSLCDYSDAYILITGNVTVAGANDNTKVAFKNWAPFRKCRTKINEWILCWWCRTY